MPPSKRKFRGVLRPSSQADGSGTGALKVAIVGFVGALIAALIALGSSLLTTHFTSADQVKDAEVTFLRTQQETTYAKYLNDEQQLFSDLYNPDQAFLGKTPVAPTPSDVSELRAKVNLDLTPVFQDADNIGLVGSAEAAVDAHGANDALQKTVTELIAGLTDEQQHSTGLYAQEKLITAQLQTDRDDVSVFVGDAGKELGVDIAK